MSQTNKPVRRAKFPAIDAHNHLWGDWSRHPEIEAVMDSAGVILYCDLTANLALSWAGGGYQMEPRNIDDFLSQCSDRFYGFTAATFTKPPEEPLFSDAEEFVADTISMLEEHVSKGAKGLKVLKELGLHYRDAEGNLLAIDDPRLTPIWEKAGELGIPVLPHQSDPVYFFEPVTPENEHYESLKKYPSWSFADKNRFPRKKEIIASRDRLIANHPETVFILPHVANYAEDLDYVSRLLDLHPNVHIDFSARIDEIGRNRDKARKFMLDYQDRIIFGTDMPASPEVYDAYFRFLESDEENLASPDYDGTFERIRWTVSGLDLPDETLKKIYHENILRLIPSLRETFEKYIR